MEEIKVYQNLENVPVIKGILDTVYQGWKWSGPYCPGKAHYLTFQLKKDGVSKFVHFSDDDYTVYHETDVKRGS